MVGKADDLLTAGIMAFREGKFHGAIVCLSRIDHDDPTIWLARFYLALSYEKSGRHIEALGLYKAINAMCPDTYVRNTADNACKLLDRKLCAGSTPSASAAKPRSKEVLQIEAAV
jgi:tetratricopeptide (TPR) repeat protein